MFCVCHTTQHHSYAQSGLLECLQLLCTDESAPCLRPGRLGLAILDRPSLLVTSLSTIFPSVLPTGGVAAADS